MCSTFHSSFTHSTDTCIIQQSRTHYDIQNVLLTASLCVSITRTSISVESVLQTTSVNMIGINRYVNIVEAGVSVSTIKQDQLAKNVAGGLFVGITC
jgi:hypothetical protein